VMVLRKAVPGPVLDPAIMKTHLIEDKPGTSHET